MSGESGAYRAPVLAAPRPPYPYVRCGEGHALRDLLAPDGPRSACRSAATLDLRAPFDIAHACDEHAAAAVRRLVEASASEPSGPSSCQHAWHVEDVAQGMVPRILCGKCGTEKPPLADQP